MAPGTDERYVREISELTESYKSFMKIGIDYLLEAKRMNDEVERIYSEAARDEITEQVYHSLNDRIEKQAEALDE